jgi:hypothetical protein
MEFIQPVEVITVNSTGNNRDQQAKPHHLIYSFETGEPGGRNQITREARGEACLIYDVVVGCVAFLRETCRHQQRSKL